MKTSLTFLSAILLFGLVNATTSCSKDSASVIPTIATTSASDVATSAATSGGTIISDGGAPIIARGVCWSTNPNPTISDNKTNDGSGPGTFTSTITGLASGVTYYLRSYATNSVGTAYGNQITVATLVPPVKFEKNVLMEQYTGTWCGYCPRAIAQIDNLMLTDKKIVHISLHLSDEMTFNLNSSLFQSFGFTGVPTVHADRSVTWSGNISAITPLHASSNAGLAINVSSSGSTITTTVRVKFGNSFSESLKLSVYLLEDGIVANQSNYYNSDPASPYYQKGSPIPNLVHKNVITKIGTDMFGDAIPTASVVQGGVYSKTVSFTGINTAKLANFRIAAFVTYSSGSNAKKVLNCIVGSVGDNTDFVQVAN
ncbi:MAG: hypothetical protein A2X18_01195 [Bacteroidetes bacterium GWF2_40_14]|nr:MAG: hypothetical protein A2X18_01195 [Bacteroidetes bacterium GWF2_40_14]